MLVPIRLAEEEEFVLKLYPRLLPAGQRYAWLHVTAAQGTASIRITRGPNRTTNPDPDPDPERDDRDPWNHQYVTANKNGGLATDYSNHLMITIRTWRPPIRVTIKAMEGTGFQGSAELAGIE